jgi:hypothetical protein
LTISSAADVDQCSQDGCEKEAHYPHDECYRHRIMSVGLTTKGPANTTNFHQTANDWKLENLGTTSDRDLAARGIERA